MKITQKKDVTVRVDTDKPQCCSVLCIHFIGKEFPGFNVCGLYGVNLNSGEYKINGQRMGLPKRSKRCKKEFQVRR